MKHLFAILLVSGLFLSTAQAQNYFGNYKGEWSSLDGDHWKFNLHLEKGISYFIWSYINPPSVPDTTTGKEYLKYTAGKTSKTMQLTGYKKEDPHNILLLGDYFLQLSEDGRILYGSMKIAGGGTFDGSRLYGYKTD